MICDRCQRPMQFATEAGNWWCSHCHRRIRPTSAGLAAPRGPRSAASSTTLPQARAVEPAPKFEPPPQASPLPGGVPPEAQPSANDASQRVIVHRPPMWPAITAVVLAMIGVGMVAAVLVRCNGATSTGAPSRALVERMLPRNALTARGISFGKLRSSDMGRQLLRSMSGGLVSEVVSRECGAGVDEFVDWMVRTDDTVSSMGNGLTAARVTWSEEQITECLTRMARSSGGMLEVKREDQLRAYVVRERGDFEADEETVYAAFLESDLALVVGDFRADRQRTVLEQTLARKEPEKGNDDLRRALGLVDLSATFWMAMSRPARDDFPEDEPVLDPDFGGDFGDPDGVERWYDQDVSGLLGARPDAVYWSVDVGSKLVVRGGAVYKSERKAERVAAHVKERLESGLGTRAPDLSRIDPAFREALEKRLRESYSRARSVRGGILDALRVEVSGDVVRFEATVSYDSLGVGPADQVGARLVDELNRLLPPELSVKL